MKEKIHYEARLNKNIRRKYYSWTTYKKGMLIARFGQKEFERLTTKNVGNYFSPQITLGHGVYEYFDIEKDIVFVKVITYTKTKESIAHLPKPVSKAKKVDQRVIYTKKTALQNNARLPKTLTKI